MKTVLRRGTAREVQSRRGRTTTTTLVLRQHNHLNATATGKNLSETSCSPCWAFFPCDNLSRSGCAVVSETTRRSCSGHRNFCSVAAAADEARLLHQQAGADLTGAPETRTGPSRVDTTKTESTRAGSSNFSSPAPGRQGETTRHEDHSETAASPADGEDAVAGASTANAGRIRTSSSFLSSSSTGSTPSSGSSCLPDVEINRTASSAAFASGVLPEHGNHRAARPDSRPAEPLYYRAPDGVDGATSQSTTVGTRSSAPEDVVVEGTFVSTPAPGGVEEPGKQPLSSENLAAPNTTSTAGKPPKTTTSPSSHYAQPKRKTILRPPQPVTKDTWDVVKDDLIEAIKEAEFVAFDLELTGLHRHATRFIGVDKCYEAHARGANHYVPVQMGLCLARRVQVYNDHDPGVAPSSPSSPRTSRTVWQLTPASVYLFPDGQLASSSSASNDGQNRNILMSAATVKFLSDNGFSFDTWVKKGLSWLKPEDESREVAAVKARMDEIYTLQKASSCKSPGAAGSSTSSSQHPTSAHQHKISVPEGPDKEVVEKVLGQIREWLAQQDRVEQAFDEETSDTAGAESRLSPLQQHEVTSTLPAGSSSSNMLQIPMENAFQRLLLHTIIAQEFPQLFSQSTRNENGRFLSVYKNQVNMFEGQLKHLEQEIEAIQKKRGVRELLDTIVESKKLLVGHNCFYDICHLYQAFFGDLPLSAQAAGGGSSSSGAVGGFTFDDMSISSSAPLHNAHDPLNLMHTTTTTTTTSGSSAARDLHPDVPEPGDQNGDLLAQKGTAHDPPQAPTSQREQPKSSLPPVAEFKKLWLAKFPKTLDTKYMSDSHDLLALLSPPSSLKELCDFMVSSSNYSSMAREIKEQNAAAQQKSLHSSGRGCNSDMVLQGGSSTASSTHSRDGAPEQQEVSATEQEAGGELPAALRSPAESRLPKSPRHFVDAGMRFTVTPVSTGAQHVGRTGDPASAEEEVDVVENYRFPPHFQRFMEDSASIAAFTTTTRNNSRTVSKAIKPGEGLDAALAASEVDSSPRKDEQQRRSCTHDDRHDWGPRAGKMPNNQADAVHDQIQAQQSFSLSPPSSISYLGEFAHDAGYDSLLTALTFLFQASYILEKKQLQWTDVAHVENLFQLSLNKIRLVRTQPNVIDLSAVHAESVASQSLAKRHFFMANYPKEWQKWEIVRVWSPVAVSVAPVNENSCWIITRTDEDAENILMIWNILKQNTKKFDLYTYEQYLHAQRNRAAAVGRVAGCAAGGGGDAAAMSPRGA
ncbi:unnamed protein product [Amoebophrya sp. A120]|nr:unnamed protein product [Amoebophrya sp. A120]|eukprot:GSA120T00015534001.1